ncbi:GntR family transcriptional regulator [Sinosporangium siamense]|uniref:GntR family transcriptional regulator n=1 Tax=Sinosporangium siamense TaxID=1367973 RepID=A0A919V9S5_9ACTN|nr:GntR family transcriptional regulator [Sinosporangium siamense]GII97515.1 hypothetical protein Ssi02_77460 [Sinosporangium siamense]
MSEPRYLQIVAELRGLIASGDQAEGDRVPATREIMRRWGVAMATAGAEGVCPVVRVLVESGQAPLGEDEQFGFGLRRILDGTAVLVP